MVGGSSKFAWSALAVDKEMVGSDKEGELTRCDGALVCCCAAARSAAVAVCGSVLVFCEGEKKLPSLIVRGDDALRGNSYFSL